MHCSFTPCFGYMRPQSLGTEGEIASHREPKYMHTEHIPSTRPEEAKHLSLLLLSLLDRRPKLDLLVPQTLLLLLHDSV